MRTEKASVVVMPAKMARGIVTMQRNGTTRPWTGLRRGIVSALAGKVLRNECGEGGMTLVTRGLQLLVILIIAITWSLGRRICSDVFRTM